MALSGTPYTHMDIRQVLPLWTLLFIHETVILTFSALSASGISASSGRVSLSMMEWLEGSCVENVELETGISRSFNCVHSKPPLSKKLDSGTLCNIG